MEVRDQVNSCLPGNKDLQVLQQLLLFFSYSFKQNSGLDSNHQICLQLSSARVLR